MSSLVYHPAYDPYGSVLRSCQFLLAYEKPIFAEELRLFDFLILFPEFISTFRLTPKLRAQFKHVTYKKRFRYESRPSAQRLFSEMEFTFQAALETLISTGLLTEFEAETGRLEIRHEAMSRTLKELALERNDQQKSLITFLVSLGSELRFFGPNGLKDRSGLLEYRYDIV